MRATAISLLGLVSGCGLLLSGPELTSQSGNGGGTGSGAPLAPSGSTQSDNATDTPLAVDEIVPPNHTPIAVARACDYGAADGLVFAYDFALRDDTRVEAWVPPKVGPTALRMVGATELRPIEEPTGPCGAAIAFNADASANEVAYAWTPNDPAWQGLPEATISFWFRMLSPVDYTTFNRWGLIGRDEAYQATSGHFIIRLNFQQQTPPPTTPPFPFRVAARWQAQCNNGDLEFCTQGQSERVGHLGDSPLGTWHHVALSLSDQGMTLYFNGAVITRTADRAAPTIATEGLGNNENPWVLGAGANTSGPASLLPLENHAEDLEMADVRLYERALSDSEVAAIGPQR